MDLGLLILRVLLGGLFIVRGVQRRYGRFGGVGREATTQQFSALGYREASTAATIVTMTEIVSGSLILLGLFVPLGAAGVVAVMVHAAVAYELIDRGPWVTNAGYEYPVVLGTLAVALAAMGPGVVSFGTLLGMTLGGWMWAFAALTLGVVTAVAFLGSREGGDLAFLDRFREDEPRRAA